MDGSPRQQSKEVEINCREGKSVGGKLRVGEGSAI